MKTRWLLSLVLACGITGLATALPLAKPQPVPMLKDAAVGFLAKYGRYIGIIGTSLVLACGPMGCGGDDVEETPTAVEQTAVEDTSSEEIEEDPSYTLVDYLGKYIAFVGDGDGSITTGYVGDVLSYIGKIEVITKNKERKGWFDSQEIRTQEVVGVMHRTHPLIDEEASFKFIVGAVPLWWNHDRWPDKLYGSIDVVYVKPVFPEGSGEPTVFGITVHSGDIGLRRVRVAVSLEDTVFIPANRVEIIDNAEE